MARCLTICILSLKDRLVRDLDSSGVLVMCERDEVLLTFALTKATGCLQPTKSSVLRTATVAVCLACTYQTTAHEQSLKARRLSAMTRHDLLNVCPENQACMLSHSAQKLSSLMSWSMLQPNSNALYSNLRKDQIELVMLAGLSAPMNITCCSLYLEGYFCLQQVRLHLFNSILKHLRLAI